MSNLLLRLGGGVGIVEAGVYCLNSSPLTFRWLCLRRRVSGFWLAVQDEVQMVRSQTEHACLGNPCKGYWRPHYGNSLVYYTYTHIPWWNLLLVLKAKVVYSAQG